MNKRILFNDNAKYEISTIDGKNTLRGYAIVWNVLSTDRGGYYVRLLPQSATFDTPTFALYHHDFKDILGRNDDAAANGGTPSLRITPDEYGVAVEIDLPDVTVGRDTLWQVKNERIKGMSFALVSGDSTVTKEKDANGNEITVVNYSRFLCDEVTVTAIPAFVETIIEVATNADTTDTQLSDIRSNALESIKDYQEQLSKLNNYKLDLYSLWLAESQQKESSAMKP